MRFLIPILMVVVIATAVAGCVLPILIYFEIL